MAQGAFEAGNDCYDMICCQRINQEAQLDTVVPDTMPDVAEIICSGGFVSLRSKNVSGGAAEIEVSVTAYVLYTPEDGGGPRSLEAALPVKLAAQNDAITAGDLCNACVMLEAVEARLLNPRKVMIRAELGGSLSVYSLRGSTICCCAPADGVYLKNESCDVTDAELVKEKTFILTDEYMLPETAPAAQLLCRRAELHLDEARPSGGRILLKGSAKSTLIYETTSGGTAQAEFTSPFSQLIDCRADAADAFPELSLMLTGVYLELQPGTDGRTVSAELHVVAQCVLRVKRTQDYTADAYSNSFELETEHKELKFCCVQSQARLTQTVTESLETPTPAAEVLDVYALPLKAETDGTAVKLPAAVCLTYRDGSGGTVCIRRRIEITFVQPLSAGEELRTGCPELCDVLAAPSAGGVQVRIRAVIPVQLVRCGSLSAVTAVRPTEKARDLSSEPSLVLVRAADGDDLWSLAKENCSSVEAIKSANSLADAPAGWSRMIIIPRTK